MSEIHAPHEKVSCKNPLHIKTGMLLLTHEQNEAVLLRRLEMNWTEAMAAMVDGQKVRSIEWDSERWVSAETSDSIGTYKFDELQRMKWEVYKDPKNVSLLKTMESLKEALEKIANLSTGESSRIACEALDAVYPIKGD